MWFADASGIGGSYYQGVVVHQTLGEDGDAWDSVTVRWDDDEEMQVCPWELKRLGELEEEASSGSTDFTQRVRAPFVGLSASARGGGASCTNGVKG